MCGNKKGYLVLKYKSNHFLFNAIKFSRFFYSIVRLQTMGK